MRFAADRHAKEEMIQQKLKEFQERHLGVFPSGTSEGEKMSLTKKMMMDTTSSTATRSSTSPASRANWWWWAPA
jgi:hypothetical protein